MSKIFEKIQFVVKRKPVIILTGEGKLLAKKAISTILKDKDLFLALADDKEINQFEFFLKNSPLSILVVTHVGDIPPEEEVFAGEKEKVIKTIELAKKLPARTFLVLNYDDETVREIDDVTNLKTLTFGFSERADFFASDIKLNHGANFKVNYKGNSIPFWLEKTFGKEQIYSALAACAVGTIFDKSLIEISQSLKEYETLPGKMRLMEGIKESFILDDSESATVFSMIEAIEILGRIPGFKRKIAVLGDIVGIGKYTIEAHERISEVVKRNAQILFTFGPRAKFIARAAFEKGMEEERIFSFDRIEDGIEKLKETIRKGDLILVDGSKEMEMKKIVDEIRKIW